MRVGYRAARATARSLASLLAGLSVQGVERIPLQGPLIVASNHRSNLDPPVLGAVLPREAFFFAKAELFQVPLLGALVRYLNAIPVRRGQFDRHALEACLQVLRRNAALVFFPEGTRAPADGFLRPKLGLGWVVCLSRAPVLPVYIHGTSGPVLRCTKRPGIRVVFGSPCPAADLETSALRGRALYQAVSDRVLDLIRNLSLTTEGGVVTAAGPIYDRTVIADDKLR